MSIIIRLQNLPTSAKLVDIRKFFGGLHIPSGGVHILGGDKGDAFIGFMSDEDARLAMRKDGGRIKDSRVKLYLSSRMEMMHEFEKFTMHNTPDIPLHEVGDPNLDVPRMRSPERRRHSRSPHHYIDWDVEKPKPENEYQRSRSPIYKAREASPKRYRSRSPRRRQPRQPSVVIPDMISASGRCASPSDLSHYEWDFESRVHQAELEKRITEELERGASFRKRNEQEKFALGLEQFDRRDIPMEKEPSNYAFFSHSPDNRRNDLHYSRNADFKNNFAVEKESLFLNIQSRDYEKQVIDDGFYITLVGMDPKWSFREVQLILKSHFAPQNNIRWEKDESGYKTGTAFVKLTNEDDYENILIKTAFFFNNRRVAVHKSPHFIVQKYFHYNHHFKNEKHIPQDHDFCYLLKGLPYTCTYEDVINFFNGFEIADLVVFYASDGQATGTGYISFTNWSDFEAAFSQNGKKIAHRYIEMLPSTRKEMVEAKKTPPCDGFVPYSKLLSQKKFPVTRRPLCAILTNLPLIISAKKVLNFFSESGLKPAAIHLTLRKQKQSDGRGFVEFSNFIDFDLALKLHGKKIDNNTVCIKQVLYDEMVKILDSQKAKHYFETQTSAAPEPISNEPEKVPYLWEPPDMEPGNETFNKATRTNPSYKGPTTSDYSAKSYDSLESKFPPNVFQRNSDSFLNHQDATSKTTNMRGSQNRTGLQEFVSPNHSKQFISAPGSDKFRSTKRYEDNIRSSRLSPDNEAALLKFLNNRKPSPGRSNRRSRTPERRNRHSYAEKNFQDSNHLTQDKCVVQMSNVDIQVGTKDLIPFLYGFDFIEDTLIRRYTAEGKATPDVRVTFNSAREAKRAVKMLNNTSLQGKKVLMFIVQ